MSHFPLRLAQLCQDCSEVGDDPLQCPACASRALLALAPVLNRGSAPLDAPTSPTELILETAAQQLSASGSSMPPSRAECSWRVRSKTYCPE